LKRTVLLTGMILLFLVLAVFPLISGCASSTPPATSSAPPASTAPAPAPTTSSPAAAVQTFKIGVVTSITGPVAPGLKSMFEGAKPTQDLLNSKGGITVAGRKYNIEYLVEDDKSSPPDGVAAVNKLIQEGVKYIVAPIFPPVGLAMAPICEQAKVIRVNPTQNEPAQFGKDNPYYFDAWMTAYDIAPTYDFLQKNYPAAKKIALIAPDDPGINTCFDLVAKECEKRGLTVVAKERFPTDTADFTPIVTKILAQKPDAIDGIGGLAIWATGYINAARDQGFTGPIYADLIIGDPNLLLNMVKPQYLNDIFEAGPDVNSNLMTPVVKELKPLVEKTGAQFILDSVNVLNATTIMLAGIQAAQSFDTDKVKTALEGLNTIETPWGTGTMTGEDLGGLKHMIKLEKVPMSWIKNGKIQFELVSR
jgi:branched-chain amino acid transport system substrate-binding protein